jgi:hypothetical protein
MVFRGRLLMGLFVGSGDRSPDAVELGVVLAAVKDAFAPLARWPEDGPSLTAAARAGMSRSVGRDGRMAAIEQKDGAGGGRRRDVGAQVARRGETCLIGLPATASTTV